MECCLFRRFSLATPTPITVTPSLLRAPKRPKKHGVLRAARLNLHDGNDDDAITRASLRLRESLRPEPLFVDPYAGCFLPPNIQMDMDMDVDTDTDTDMEPCLHHYCLGTKFIDDKLLTLTKNLDGPKQVVLLTDGMDTRAYRLNWLTSTIIFDVSPERIFKTAAQKLQDVGAKIPRKCLLIHVPSESSNIHQILRDKGFSGSRPSVWAFQGLPLMNLARFKDILFIVSSLAVKGCIFLGEFPAWLTETEIGIKPSRERWMDELFMSYGFRVNMIGYDEVARDLGKKPAVEDYKNILFVAEHLRFSDDQLDTWRREFQRLEEEGDEEGFEEL